MGIIRIGFWDCTSCGKTGNLGDDKTYNCPACGHPRPEDVEFYLTADSPVVTDEEEIKDAEAGPDWLCIYCDQYNPARDTACQNCGSIRGGHNPQQAVGDYVPTEQLLSSSEKAKEVRLQKGKRADEKKVQAAIASSGNASQNPRSLGCLFAGLAGIVLLLGLSLLIYTQYFQTHPVTATVSGFTWTREQDVEVYGTVQEEDWTIPTGGREVSHSTRVKGHVKVRTGDETKTRRVGHTVYGSESYSCTKSLGNGRYKTDTCTRRTSHTEYENESYTVPTYREDPVYGTWYVYQIEKWHLDHTDKTQGNNQLPTWPEVATDATHRVGAQRSHYFVYFSHKDKTYQLEETSLEQWQQLKAGQSVTLNVTKQGEVKGYTLKT